MKSISKIPSKPEIKTCPIHGDFEVKYLEVMPGRVWVKENCSTCAKVKHEEEMQRAQRQEEEQKIFREKERLTKARERANISPRNMFKSFSDYIAETQEQKHAVNVCQKYIEQFPSQNSLLMLGMVGTGKTLLASMMLDKICETHSCEIIKVIDLIRRLKSTWSKTSDITEADMLNRYTTMDLLVIDEVGVQFGSDTEKLFIFDIIDGRYQNMLPTILISNLDIENLKTVVGDRVIDRLREGGGEMLAFNWESYRGQS